MLDCSDAVTVEKYLKNAILPSEKLESMSISNAKGNMHVCHIKHQKVVEYITEKSHWREIDTHKEVYTFRDLHDMQG